MEDRNRLMTLAEVAAYIRHAPGSLRNMISQGNLPFKFIKWGRKILFDRRDVDKWIDHLPRFGGKDLGSNRDG